MTQEATGRCNDEALTRVVAAIIGRLTPADRQRIEAAEAQADHAGLHLGASAQASADTMRRIHWRASPPKRPWASTTNAVKVLPG